MEHVCTVDLTPEANQVVRCVHLTSAIKGKNSMKMVPVLIAQHLLELVKTRRNVKVTYAQQFKN